MKREIQVFCKLMIDGVMQDGYKSPQEIAQLMLEHKKKALQNAQRKAS
jgi:hypothetical protein